MTAALEKTWVHHAEPSGKGLKWAADMAECAALGWWSRWDGAGWELCGEDTPGRVEDLARLASVRAGHGGETDDAWAELLAVKNAGQWHDPEVRRTRRPR